MTLYYISRRGKVPEPNTNSISHVTEAVATDVTQARQFLIDAIAREVRWLECEHAQFGGQWRLDRVRRLRVLMDIVPSFTDGVYRSVEADGVRYGWLRDD